MSRSAFVVRCSVRSCLDGARYKVAAEWSDGTTKELKTYALACEKHVELLYRQSREKQQGCRVAEGETLSAPRIFRIEEGRRDRELVRLIELETALG